MRPQERRREFLQSQGYLIVRNFFASGEVTRVRHAQDAYYQGESNLTPTFQWPQSRPCSVRSRKHGEEGLMTTPDFIIRLQTEIRNYGG